MYVMFIYFKILFFNIDNDKGIFYVKLVLILKLLSLVLCNKDLIIIIFHLFNQVMYNLNLYFCQCKYTPYMYTIIVFCIDHVLNCMIVITNF